MRITSLLLALLGGFSTLLHAGDRGPSTPEERARYNALVKKLVESPLDLPKKEELSWAIHLGVEIPDFTASLCLDDTSTSLSKNKTDIGLFWIFTLAPFSVQFQHPQSVKDQPAIDTLVWNWILDAYERILTTKPRENLKLLDDALALRNNGKLSEYVRGVSCAKGKDWHEPPAWALTPNARVSAPVPASVPAASTPAASAPR